MYRLTLFKDQTRQTAVDPILYMVECVTCLCHWAEWVVYLKAGHLALACLHAGLADVY